VKGAVEYKRQLGEKLMAQVDQAPGRRNVVYNNINWTAQIVSLSLWLLASGCYLAAAAVCVSCCVVSNMLWSRSRRRPLVAAKQRILNRKKKEKEKKSRIQYHSRLEHTHLMSAVHLHQPTAGAGAGRRRGGK
jgi:hypothetical protein